MTHEESIALIRLLSSQIVGIRATLDTVLVAQAKIIAHLEGGTQKDALASLSEHERVQVGRREETLEALIAQETGRLLRGGE